MARLLKAWLLGHLVVFTSLAGELDQSLASYIKKFNLKSLDYPTPEPQARVLLGARLFFERKLSGNMNVSCGSCHMVPLALGDGVPLGLGEGAQITHLERRQAGAPLLPRHTPHLINIGLVSQELFWDGRVAMDQKSKVLTTPYEGLNGQYPRLPEIALELKDALSAQALFPLLSPEEMLGAVGENDLADLTRPEEIWQGLLERLLYGAQASAYQKAFAAAFPKVPLDELNIGHVAAAMGSYMKHGLIGINTPWDHYLQGDLEALSEKSKRGALVFMERGRCVNCHNGPALSNFEYRNIAIPPIGPGLDEAGQDYGRARVTGLASDRYKFKTPALRNVLHTAPYMHNGAFATLEEVIEHYNHVRHNFMHYETSALMSRYGKVYDQRIERVFERERVIEMFNQLDPEVWPPLFLTVEEKSDLLEFLKVALTSKNLEFYKPWSK